MEIAHVVFTIHKLAVLSGLTRNIYGCVSCIRDVVVMCNVKCAQQLNTRSLSYTSLIIGVVHTQTYTHTYSSAYLYDYTYIYISFSCKYMPTVARRWRLQFIRTPLAATAASTRYITLNALHGRANTTPDNNCNEIKMFFTREHQSQKTSAKSTSSWIPTVRFKGLVRSALSEMHERVKNAFRFSRTHQLHVRDALRPFRSNCIIILSMRNVCNLGKESCRKKVMYS